MNKAQVKPLIGLVAMVLVIGLVFASYGTMQGVVRQGFDTLLDLFRTTSEDVRAMRSAEALQYAINCESYIGAGAVNKYRRHCSSAALKNDPWIDASSFTPGLGRNFGKATVYCFPPGSERSEIKQTLKLEKDGQGLMGEFGTESYMSSCVVENFKLPQNLGEDKGGMWNTIIDLVKGESAPSPREWMEGFGDPQFLLYYSSFPKGEEKDWQLSEIMVSRAAIVTSSMTAAGINLLFGFVPSLMRGAKRVTRRALRSSASQKVGDMLNNPIQRSLIRMGIRSSDDAVYHSVKQLSDNVDDLVARNMYDVAEEARSKAIRQADSWDEAVEDLVEKRPISRSQANDILFKRMDDEVDKLLRKTTTKLPTRNLVRDLVVDDASDDVVKMSRRLLDQERKLRRQRLGDDEILEQLRKLARNELADTFSGKSFNQLARAKFADDVVTAAQRYYDPYSGQPVRGARSKIKRYLVSKLDLADNVQTRETAESIVNLMKKDELVANGDLYDEIMDYAYKRAGVYGDQIEDYGRRAIAQDMAEDTIAANKFNRNLIARKWDGAHRVYDDTKRRLTKLGRAVNPKHHLRLLGRLVKKPFTLLRSGTSRKSRSFLARHLWPVTKRLLKTRALQIEAMHMVDRGVGVPDWAKRSVITRHCLSGFGRFRSGFFTKATYPTKLAACYIASGIALDSVKLDSAISKFKSGPINSIMLSKTMIDYGRVGDEYFGKSNRLSLNQYAKHYAIRLNKAEDPNRPTKIRFYAAAPCHAHVVVKNKTEECTMELLTEEQVQTKYPDIPIRDAVERDGQVYFSPQPIFSFGQPPEMDESDDSWNSLVQMEGPVTNPGLVGGEVKTYFERKVKDKCIKQALGITTLQDYNINNPRKYGCGLRQARRGEEVNALGCALSDSNINYFKDCVAAELRPDNRQELSGNEMGAKNCGKTSWLRPANKFLESIRLEGPSFLSKPDYKQSQVKALSVTLQPVGDGWEAGSGHNYCYADKDVTERASYWGVVGGMAAGEAALSAAIYSSGAGVVALGADSILGGAVVAIEQLTLAELDKVHSWPNR